MRYGYRPRSRRIYVALGVALLVVAGCQSFAPPAPSQRPTLPAPLPSAPAPPEELPGSSWRAVSIDGSPVNEAPSTLEFVDGRRVAGSLGCNRYTASYVADALGLRFASLAATRMQCDSPRMKQEERFAAVLREARGLRFDDAGSLLLLDAAGTVRAALVRANH